MKYRSADKWGRNLAEGEVALPRGHKLSPGTWPVQCSWPFRACVRACTFSDITVVFFQSARAMRIDFLTAFEGVQKRGSRKYESFRAIERLSPRSIAIAIVMRRSHQGTGLGSIPLLLFSAAAPPPASNLFD